MVTKSKQKFNVGDNIKVRGSIKSRHGKDPNGRILSFDPCGTYTVELWGVAGPGDEVICGKVPEEAITLLDKNDSFPPTIPGMQSYEECKKSIVFYGNLIDKSDDTFTSVNRLRLQSLRAVIDLYERYLDIIEKNEE